MASNLIVGGMPDTMEWYTMFHLTLKYDGPLELLKTMMLIIIMMVFATIQYDQVVQIIDECVVRRSK